MSDPPSSPTNVLITGGADGLGKALAIEFLNTGAERITVLDIDQEKGHQLEKSNPGIVFTRFDLAAFSDAEIGNLPGPFDTVICNAGISACGNFKDTPWETERQLFEVNLLGHMRLIKQLLRQRWVQNSGRIAFTASATVFTPFPVAVAYAASKAGMDGFANALEPYLIPQKISVTRIYPGSMRTAHQEKYYLPKKKDAGVEPATIARRVVKAIRKRKRHVYPDLMGKGFKTLSWLVPWAMPKLALKATPKRYKDLLYPDES